VTAREQLNSYIEQLEKRLRLGVLLRGAAVVLATALATTVVLVLIANALAFSKTSVTGARSILFILVACAIGFALALPLMRLNPRRAAATAEQAFPEFQERLVTMAERDAAERQPFVELLASDTLKIAQKSEAAYLVPNNRLLASLGIGVASLGVLVWLILAGPGYLGYGAALLWAGDAGATPLYDLHVNPGNAVVRRNADLLVTALPRGIQPDKVRIYARYESASKWEQLPMQSQAGASGYQFLFAGLPEGVEYYVEAGPLRSRHFNIRVVDLPTVKQIRVTYHYPAWTGMSASAGQPGGDLRAVEGTQAELDISMDRPLTDGLLVLDDQKQLQLSGGQGNVYKGMVTIDKDGAYHVSTLDRGQEVRISEDFFIEADKATAPDVAIARPGGDYRASPIEEVTVSAKADDPFGLSEFSLHYAVNGGPEQSVNLLKQSGAKTADGSTTLYLENFKVVPGDIVSLYATAKDARAESRTDMFFIQAEPFEREFSQSQQSGGGAGGGAGGNAPDEISQREKEIIGATWKQSGDKDAAAAEKAAENAKFLSGVQSKLRDQGVSLAGRLQMRDLTQQNAEFTDFQKDMTAAADAMGPASTKLQQQKWKDAIPDEQKALQHLLRAEATFRQIQVAFGNAGGGGGGAGTAGRDLASLFDLELDTQKNQYEVGQTAESAKQRAQDIDEALRKLDELARRQDELASQQRNGQSSDQRWQQEMLRRQAEELQRQMEQLTRNGQQGSGGSSGGQQGQSQGAQGSQGSQSSQQSSGSQNSNDARVQQALNQLRQANDDMRRAASQQQSQADARRAAERLKQATSLLGGAQQQQSSARLDGMANEADRLAQEHKSQTERMQQMSKNQYNVGPDGNYSSDVGGQQSKLAEDRQRLADDLSRMEKDMRDAVRDLSSTDRAAASKLRDALRQLDQSDLDTRIQRSADSIRRGVNPAYGGTEPQIASGLQQLSQQVHEAQQALGSGSPQNSQQDAINQVQSLRDRLESLDRSFGGGNRSGANNSNSANSQGTSQGNSQGNPQGNSQGGTQDGQRGGPGANIGQFVGGGNRGGYGDSPYYGGMNAGNNGRLPQPVPPDTFPVPPETAYRESLGDLDKLRQSVQNDPETLRQVEKLIEEMQRLDPSRFPGNPALVEELHGQVLADVDKLELQLQRNSDGDRSGEVRGGDSLPVPPGYQDAVAEYFRRLSKNP
jgi:hypothetical protein